MFLHFKNKLLVGSSNLLLVTFYFFQKYSLQNNFECYLLRLTIISYFLALLFWRNPKKVSANKKFRYGP